MDRLLHASSRHAAVLCGAAALLFRLLLLVAPPPDLWFQGAPWTEEWLRGNIAHELIHGPLLPLHDHQIPCWGGMNCMGFLAVPPFLAFGETLFALRLATLPFAFLLAACGFLLLDRTVSRRAAWIGGMLLAFTPPGWSFTSITAQGTHLELATLSVGLLWVWSEDLARGGSHKGWSFASGLALGAHASFGWGIAMALVPLGDWIRDRRFFLRPAFVPRVSGLVLGLVPLAVYQLEYGDALSIYDRGLVESVTPAHAAAPLEKLRDLLLRDFADSFWFAEPAPGGARTAGAFLAAVLCAAWWRMAWLRRAELLAFLRGLAPWSPPQPQMGVFALVLLMPALYLLLYLGSPFGLGLREWLIDYRYLLVPQAFLLLAAAAAGDQLMERKPWRTAVPAAAWALCSICVWSALTRCQWSRASEMWSVRGSRPESVSSRLLWKHGTDPGRLSEFLRRIAERRESPMQEALYYELARNLRTMAIIQQRRNVLPAGPHDDPLQALSTSEQAVPAQWKAYFRVERGRVEPLASRSWELR